MKRLLILAGVATLATGAHANLIANGDFETFTPSGADVNGGNYFQLNNGNTALANWTIGGRGGDVSVDVVSGWTHFDAYGVDLAGSPGPGSIAQAVSGMVAGNFYTISFRALGMQDGINDKVVVDLGGTTYTQTVATGSTTGANSQMGSYSITLQAGNSNNLLRLGTELTNNTNGNLLVDNVQVNAVPEPFTMSLGLASAGLFLRRRLKAKQA